ncbi:hypothetical protein PROFUN_06643 [Planoprotostelium fungivorum]|uniref:Uncharacterized protein n=1 Tax=Planoprotostelium fungivorum TaxID=1890364 RepID=A0A2P6MSV0_9EUKA|nr:hypothetical protein PROFUN_06643 [Planoprotostelium fungivorum]
MGRLKSSVLNTQYDKPKANWILVSSKLTYMILPPLDIVLAEVTMTSLLAESSQ